MTFDPTTVGDATNVLLLDSTTEPNADLGACEALLDDDVHRVGEVHVVYGGTNGGTVHGTDRDPARRGIIAVGDTVRSTASEGGPDFSGAVAIDAIADPGDLQRVGVSISEFVEQWGDLDRILLCFDSVTELLEHAPPETAFRFVHAVIERLESADGVSHFHFDPTGYDETVVDTFKPLFDAVERVEPSDESSLDVASAETFEQASDEDVLETQSELDGESVSSVESDRRPSASRRDVNEATDEDVARALDE